MTGAGAQMIERRKEGADGNVRQGNTGEVA